MRRLLLIYQSEGGAVLRRDFEALDFEVDMAPLADAESALVQPGIEAVVIEAGTSLEETHRLLESPARPSRVPLLLGSR